jgi:hypothetical protein
LNPPALHRSPAAIAAALALTLLTQAPACAADTPDAAFGKQRVAEYVVPADIVARYASHRPSAPVPGEPKLINALMADAVDWTGPPLDVGPGRNPYTVVMHLRGRALADGAVTSLWRAGWRLELSDGGTRDRVDAITGIGRDAARAGEVLEFSVPSGGTSFTEDRQAVPLVSLVHLRNLKVESLRVEVWQGAPRPGWVETLLSLRALGVGLVMLLLIWWWRRR